MNVETMANPLGKIKKVNSLDEFLTRGGQVLHAFREQRRAGSVPSDKEFVREVNAEYFGSAPVIAESLWKAFYKNGDAKFFPAFRRPQQSAGGFREQFGDERAGEIIASAEDIVAGRIDLLGLKSLYVGTEIDWHREPVSAKRSPLKHWKKFDELDTRETGDRKIIWELNRHQHFFTLGVAFWLTGDERFAATFVSHLETWIEQNPPGLGINWSSSLEVSFRAMSWLWAFHFFHDSEAFTPSLFKEAVKFLHLHGRHIEQYLSKYYSPNTHLTGEGLGLYYLGTQLPFLNRAAQWRELGEDILFSEITRQILPDGVYFEQSICYQRYTVDIYSHFVVLRSLFGEPFYNGKAAALEGRLEKAFGFLASITQPDGRTPLIGDDDGGRLLPLTGAEPDDLRGSLSLGGVILGRGDLKYVAETAGEEMFWLTGSDGVSSFDGVAPTEPATTSREFSDGGYCVMRDGWGDTDNYLIVDHGEVGSLSGGHGHADALSIEVALQGKTLLVDSGTYTYHESRELRDYFRSTTAHNTLVIDGESSSVPGSTFGWKTKSEAEKNRWIDEDRFTLFAGSHNGYQRLDKPATHTREILFLKNDYWIIRDLAETTGTHEYSLGFHFAHGRRPAIGDDGLWVGEDDHRIFTFGDHGVWRQKESWISIVHGNRMNASFLQFVSTGEGTQEFFTFIVPSNGIPSEVEEIGADAGRAFVIKYAGYTDLFIFGDAGETIDNGIFESNFRYSWARLREGENVPDEFVLIDGDRLRIADYDILTERVDHATARRFGSELYVKTPDRRLKKRLN